MKEIDEKPAGNGLKIAIAVSRFNQPVTRGLLDGCRAALVENGVEENALTLVHVPGAWELPLVCDRLAAAGRFDAIIALGCVIRGETAHFDFIAGEAARGLNRVGLEYKLPVAFGVLTPENREQALERSDPKQRNKGREVALAALEMVQILRVLD